MTDPRNRDYLPAGLSLDAEPLPGTAGFGAVYAARDERYGDAPPLERVVRFVDVPAGAPWRSEFDRRLIALLGTSIPCVSTPREAGCPAPDVVYLVDNDDGQPLRALVPAQNGLESEQAEAWLRQIVDGLAGLHARQLPHGDLRPGNVLIGQHPATASIANAATGPLTYWTNGHRLHEESTRYYPPEWKGDVGPPSFAADLYALGVMACEMFLGSRLTIELLHDAGGIRWKILLLRLREVGVRRPTQRLLKQLLKADPSRRPASAAEVQEIWQRFERADRRRRGTVWAAVLMVSMIALGLVAGGALQPAEELDEVIAERNQLRQNFQQTRAELDNVTIERVELVQEVAELTRRVDDLKRDNEQLTAERAGLIQVTRERDELAESLGRVRSERDDLHQRWTELRRRLTQVTLERDDLTERLPRIEEERDGLREDLSQAKVQLDTTQKAFAAVNADNHALRDENLDHRIQRGLEEPPGLTDARKLWAEHDGDWEQVAGIELDAQLDHRAQIQRNLDRWSNEIRHLDVQGRRWFGHDPPMRRLYEAARLEPWEGGNVEQARRHLAALEEAETKWRAWAYDDTVAWEDIEQLIDNPAISAAAQDTLKRWHRALIARRGHQWKLFFTKGEAPPDWGTDRMLGLEGQHGWIDGDVHAWDSETEHPYEPRRFFKFHWQPGSPIAIRMYGHRSRATGRRHLLIGSQSFAGPLAIWRLHDRGRVEDGDFALEIELAEYPGPPRRDRPIPARQH